MPTDRLPPHFVFLVQEALLKSFNRKKTLRRFLLRSHISENKVASYSDADTKREWLDDLFPILERNDKGRAVIQDMARSLAEQQSFPDLAGHEESPLMIANATEAVRVLREYLEQKDQTKHDEQERQAVRERAREAQDQNIRTQNDLKKLTDRLNELSTRLGTVEAGNEFQDWFYDLMEFFDIDSRLPYHAGGRQIDGSITIDGTTYLVELKFTAEPTGSPDIDSLVMKLKTKADNTMGVFVSISGFTRGKGGDKGAIATASFNLSPLLLFDHGHLYMALHGSEAFPDIVRRVRRHSSQTGQAYLAASDFSGR
jgi:hypothetical protein